MYSVTKVTHTIALALYLLLFTALLFTGCSQKTSSSNRITTTKYTSKARHKATMRPYTVMGKRYYPSYVEVGQTMRGIASWYGPNFHGKRTSNGERYNMHARTAAHKTLPMDTIVKVTNLQNDKSTIVRINDRGPFVKGRIIDCSYKAGKEIGLDKMGIAKVEVEVLGFAGKMHTSARINNSQTSSKPTRVILSNFGIQVGAFRNLSGATKTKHSYMGRYSRYNPIIKHHTLHGSPLYRVWLMGFGSEEEARDFIRKHRLHGAFIVRE